MFTVCIFEEERIIFSASFFVTEIEWMKFAYVANLKTAGEHRNQGFALTFFQNLTNFLGIGLVEVYRSAYIIVNAIEGLTCFYTNRGFKNAP